MKNTADDRHPEGSILMLTLIILILMGLMGAAILLTTKTDLRISYNTYLGRDAFIKADSTARIGLLMGRALLHEGAGTPEDLRHARAAAGASRPPFEVRLDPGFTLENVQALGAEGTAANVKKRYLMASAAEQPHITVLYDGKVVGTAAVALEQTKLDEAGGSLGQDTYDTNDGTAVRVLIVVSANGRIPRAGAADAGNYYTGDSETAHSIITTVFMETLP